MNKNDTFKAKINFKCDGIRSIFTNSSTPLICVTTFIMKYEFLRMGATHNCNYQSRQKVAEGHAWMGARVYY